LLCYRHKLTRLVGSKGRRKRRPLSIYQSKILNNN